MNQHPNAVLGDTATVARPPQASPVADSAAARPSWIDRGRIPALDGLRAVSIVLVVGEHFTLANGFRPASAFGLLLGHLGSIGVDIFFTISGFLITTLLLREWHRNDSISLRAFYIRRFLRIMPAALVFLMVIAALQVTGLVELSTRNWLHALTYTVNFDPAPAWEVGHLWSLSIEEHFYLLWPLALLLLKPRAAGTLAFVWLVVSPVLRLVVLLFHRQDMGDYELWTPLRIDSISAGCLLAVLSHDERFRRLATLGESTALLLVGTLPFIIAGSYLLGTRIDAYGVVVEPSVRALCIALLVWLSINHYRSSWGRLLESKPFVMTGLLSYSLYLWQQPFTKPDGGGVLENTLGMVVAVACAIASYKLVERPFLRLKDRAQSA